MIYTFWKNPDITIWQFVFNTEKIIKAAVIFLENMADKDMIKKNILNPLKAGALEIPNALNKDERES